MAPKQSSNLGKANKALKDKRLAANPVHHLFGYYYYFIY